VGAVLVSAVVVSAVVVSVVMAGTRAFRSPEPRNGSPP
jgi:hypothetical protein